MRDEMSRACNTYERDDKCIQNLVDNHKRYDLVDLGVDGRILLKMIFTIQCLRNLYAL